MAGQPTPEERERLDGLQTFRDRIRSELLGRKLGYAALGRPTHPDCRGVSTEQLVEEEAWYVAKIDEILAPYEN